MCKNIQFKLYLSFNIGVCIVNLCIYVSICVFGWLGKQHHHQSELQITSWRCRHGMQPYIKLTVAACIWWWSASLDKALQTIWLQSRWRMSFSGTDVVHPADAPSSHRKLLCTLWCLLVSQTSLCSLLCRLSSLSVWLLIIQRQTDLRSSAAAAKEKQERWRSSTRPTERTHEIRRTTFGRIAWGEDCTSEFFCVCSCSIFPVSSRFRLSFQGLRERRYGRSWDIIWRAPREWPGKSWSPLVSPPFFCSRGPCYHWEGSRGEIFSSLSLFLIGWSLLLAPVQPKSSGSSRFPVNILTSLALPRYVAFRFVVKVTQGNGRGGVKRLACVFRQHRSASVLLFWHVWSGELLAPAVHPPLFGRACCCALASWRSHCTDCSPLPTSLH